MSTTARALDVSHRSAHRWISGRALRQANEMLDAAPAAARAQLRARIREIAGPRREFYADGTGRVRDTWNDAQGQLIADHAALSAARVPIAFDDDEIDSRAHSAAYHCRHAASDAAALAFCDARGIARPKGRNVTPRSARRRLNEPRWWRRRLRAQLTRRAENAFRQIGLVHRHASPYVTGDGLARYAQQQRKSAEWLAKSDAVCVETGELFPLGAIAAKSISNPAIRRGELMMRVRGFEECAQAEGHGALFVTLTAPSAFHAYTKDGRRNPRWIGAGVRDAQQWLCRQWARARAKLARLSVLYYGLRVAEPHHDGTPHWHLLIFGAAAALATVRHVLAAVWLAGYRDEPGAAEHRAKFIDIDPAKGTASGYVAKYVSKSVDGHALADDDPEETALAGADAASRVVAWARIHGIRQFQQLGGPSVTLWRELRRVREPIEGADGSALESARSAADDGDWRKFIDALGGIALARKAPAVQLDKAMPETIDPAGRKVLRLTAYGELPEPRPIGARSLRTVVQMGITIARWVRVVSRLFSWRRVSRAASSVFSSLGPVEIIVRGSSVDPVGPDRSAGVDYSWIATIPLRGAARAGP